MTVFYQHAKVFTQETAESLKSSAHNYHTDEFGPLSVRMGV